MRQNPPCQGDLQYSYHFNRIGNATALTGMSPNITKSSSSDLSGRGLNAVKFSKLSLILSADHRESEVIG
jgi:hypothetical protein